jgi:hypothetical protein
MIVQLDEIANSYMNELVQRASSIVWKIERPYVRWFFSGDSRVKSPSVQRGIQSDGFEATVFWRASQFWFTLGSFFIVIGLPFAVIGILANPTNLLGVVVGSVFYVIGLSSSVVGITRRKKFRGERLGGRLKAQ